MEKIKENFGYWTAASYGDGWTTFERTNGDGSKTLWNEVAQAVCPLDENGLMTSSKHPFYARVDATGTVLNCYDDIWKLVPHENVVIAVSQMVATGSRFVDGSILPPAPPPYVPIRLQKSAFVLRLTEDEHDAFEASVLKGETARMRSAYNSASEFVEDDAIWNLVVKHLRDLVSAERLAELLARP